MSFGGESGRMGHAEGALGLVGSGDSMSSNPRSTSQALTPCSGVRLAEVPQGRCNCPEKALVLKFTLPSDVQVLHTQAAGSVMKVLSVNE